jgi:large subunit ribosomal protein L33
MAKPVTQKIKLVSSAGTGFYYVTKKNPRNQTEKLVFKKYDPVGARRRILKPNQVGATGGLLRFAQRSLTAVSGPFQRNRWPTETRR